MYEVEPILRPEKTTQRHDPLFVRRSTWLSTRQALIWQSDVKDITGWTWRGDLQTLFELAYYSPGDVLEIGYHSGRSTTAIAMGLAESGDFDRTLVSIDKFKCPEVVRRLLRDVYSPELTEITRTESIKFLRQDKRKFGFVFVDSNHKYEHVSMELKLLQSKIVKGGFLACHDCYANGTHPGSVNIAKSLQRATFENLKPVDWAFWGRYGMCGVWLRLTDPQEA